MRKLFYLFVALMVASPTLSWAQDAENDEPVVTEADQNKWETGLKTKYSLTDEQIKQMRDSGATYPAMTKAAALAAAASTPEKPLTASDILKMRTEGKGWGKIAHELGVHPNLAGQSVAEINKGHKMEKKTEKRMAKAAAKAEKKAAKANKKSKKQ